MLRRLLASTRYLVIIAVVSTLAASIALLVYEAVVVFSAIRAAFTMPDFTAVNAKIFAVGLIEAVDIFLIAIAVYMISLGLYALFVDSTLPLPRWLEVHDLDDLKNNLVSIVIAVLAVLFLRVAVAWDGEQDLLGFGIALALVIAALTYFLTKQRKAKE
jgi:uncharacterized membrane protein YqhA